METHAQVHHIKASNIHVSLNPMSSFVVGTKWSCSQPLGKTTPTKCLNCLMLTRNSFSKTSRQCDVHAIVFSSTFVPYSVSHMRTLSCCAGNYCCAYACHGLDFLCVYVSVSACNVYACSFVFAPFVYLCYVVHSTCHHCTEITRQRLSGSLV